jgi:DNA-binding Lrp family transcriptional regulator
MTITESELLDAIRAATTDDDGPTDAMTGPELALAMGITDSPMRTRLRRLMKDGVIECVKVKRTSIAGVSLTVPAYRLIAKPKKAKRAK